MRPQRLIREHILLFIGALAFLAFLALRWGERAAPTMNRQVAELALQLHDPSVQQRRQAAEALAHRAAEASPAQDSLLAALADGDLLVRSHAALALGRMQPPAIEQLMATLDHPFPGARHAAAAALGLVGAPAAPAVPKLVELLRSREDAVRYAARESLGRIGPAAVSALLEELRAGPPVARVAAADALGAIGRPSASLMAEPLGVALNDSDESVRQSAASALVGLGEVAGPILANALCSPHPEIRRIAAQSLAYLGIAAAPAAAKLIDSLADPDSLVRSAAANALGQIGHPARAAVPTLLALQNDDASVVRSAATRALIRIIGDAPRAELGRNVGGRIPQTHLNP